MLDISVIILTYNEEIHIRRCLENAKLFAREIFIVDSFSTDKTCDIATEMGAFVYQNKWENNHSKQLNWGLINLPITSSWVLRLDADEYLTSQLIKELEQKLPNLDENVSGIIIPLKRIFMGRHIQRGTAGVTQMRIFRYGKARCEDRFMDEHIEITEGISINFNGAWVDDNLNSIDWWMKKHIGYAIREAVDLLDIELNITGIAAKDSDRKISPEALRKRAQKHKYARMPLFWRSFLYFFIRFILKGGFMEGKEGFMWHFFQGWWYRTLVDVKIFEIKHKCGNNQNKIKEFIKNQYSIDL